MKPASSPYLLLAALVPLLLAGCVDPYDRQGTWSLPPEGLGANDTNLRAMVTNPQDLTSPHGDEDTAAAALATRPVDNLYAGRRARLPNVNASSIGTSGSNSGTQQNQQGSGGGGSLGTGTQY